MELSQLFFVLGFTLFLSSVFEASENTTTFQGEVTEETFTVAVKGESTSPVVLLENVSKSPLTTNGDTAGGADVDISISGCASNAAGVPNFSTVFVGNQVTGSGNLGNTDSATNVEIQILDKSGSAIDLTGAARAVAN